MKGKAKILCILIILIGIVLFFLASFHLEVTAPIMHWVFGLGSALIILGIGLIINSVIEDDHQPPKTMSKSMDQRSDIVKERSGYMVCKLMNILLCIYVLILRTMKVNSIILFISIVILLLQFIFDLVFQVYYNNKI